jgi:hypothetical protein
LLSLDTQNWSHLTHVKVSAIPKPVNNKNAAAT